MIKNNVSNNWAEICLNCKSHNRLDLQQRVFSEISEELLNKELVKEKEKISRFGAEGKYIDKNISAKLGDNIGIEVYSPFILFPNKTGNVKYKIIYSSYQFEKEEIQDCNCLGKIVTEIANMVNKYDSLV